MTAVVFATEYDTANIIFGILTNATTGHNVFPLLVRHRPSRTISFCLQTQRCNDSVRIGAVFVCDNAKLNLASYVTTGRAIPTSILADSLDEEATRSSYEHLLNSQPGKTGRDDVPAGFRHLVYFNKSAVIRYLNTTYLSPTSPSWFTSMYGPTEGMLLLTMYYYLFERQCSTIQTTRDYVRCFTSDTGTPILNYASMYDFMRTLLLSRFRTAISRFSTYARRRNARDRAELEFVDEQINKYRERCRLPDEACVHYIYLGYRTALNRDRVLRYCELTQFDSALEDDEQCAREDRFLGLGLDRDLISIMDKYFSPADFFEHYVSKTLTEIPDSLQLFGYDWESEGRATVGFFGSVHDITRAIARVNEDADGIFTPLPETMAGFLTLCSSERSTETTHSEQAKRQRLTHSPIAGSPAPETTLLRRDLLLKRPAAHYQRRRGPPPVFRVELAGGRHLFCTLTRENWFENVLGSRAILGVPDRHTSDELVTDSVFLEDNFVATTDYRKQLYLTRHELFNESLPVFNFVGDFDMKLREDRPGIQRELLFKLCRGIRRAILVLWGHAFETVVDTQTHPVYFFKTSCFTPEPEIVTTKIDESPPDCDMWSPGTVSREFAVNDQETYHESFCTCRRKIGLRVISPFPQGTAVIGSETLRHLSAILNHVLFLDHELSRELHEVAHPGDYFDTGIYHSGRSIRVPYMYKIDAHGGRIMYGRLVPLFIVPEAAKNDVKSFVRKQMDIKNLLHHARPDINGPVRLVNRVLLRIRDSARPDPTTSFIDSRAAVVSRYPRPFLGTLIYRFLHNTDALSASSTAASPSLRDTFQTATADFPTSSPSDVSSDGDDVSCVLTRDDLLQFIKTAIWPQFAQQLGEHYETRVSAQFDHVIFDVRNLHQVAVKRLEAGRVKDFVCLTRAHRVAQENVQVFIDLRGGHKDIIWATLWSRCFTTKCHSNAKQVHASVFVRVKNY